LSIKAFDVSPLGAPSSGAHGEGDWKTIEQAEDTEGVVTPDRAGQKNPLKRKDDLKIVFNPMIVTQPGLNVPQPAGTHSTDVRFDRYGGAPTKVKLPYSQYPDEGTREYYYAPGQGSLTDSAQHVQSSAQVCDTCGKSCPSGCPIRFRTTWKPNGFCSRECANKASDFIKGKVYDRSSGKWVSIPEEMREKLGLAGIGPAVPAAVPPMLNSEGPGTPDTYHEDATNLSQDSTGQRAVEQDTNFSKPWRFKHRDKDVSVIIPPETEHTSDLGHEDVLFPLTGARLPRVLFIRAADPPAGLSPDMAKYFEELRVQNPEEYEAAIKALGDPKELAETIEKSEAASVKQEQSSVPAAKPTVVTGYGDVGNGYRFGKPRALTTIGKDRREAQFESKVSFADQKYPQLNGEYFIVRFWMDEDSKKRGQADLSASTETEITDIGGESVSDNLQAQWLVRRIPADVLRDAAEQMNMTYGGKVIDKESQKAKEEHQAAETELLREKAETARKKAEAERAKQSELDQKQAEVTQKSIERNQKKAEKVGKRKGKTYNVLQDPALENLDPKMPDVEKLFTPIRDWDDDEYTTTLDSLDGGTRQMLEANPRGQGTYFNWSTVSEKEAKEIHEDRVREMGVDPAGETQGKGLLLVTRLPAWKAIEEQVRQSRR